MSLQPGRDFARLQVLSSSELVMRAPNAIDVYVGKRLRMRRLMLEMSQEALADALGLTFQQVQKYEKGANRVGASRLQKLSEVLQVPVGFFFEGLSTKANANGAQSATLAYVADFAASSDGLALMRSFSKISDATLRRRIVELVERVAGGPEAN
jgi:transcriptional regulator with XRE-family HTH domain